MRCPLRDEDGNITLAKKEAGSISLKVDVDRYFDEQVAPGVPITPEYPMPQSLPADADGRLQKFTLLACLRP